MFLIHMLAQYLILSPTIFILEKLTAYVLDGCTASWVKNWLDGEVHTLIVNGVKTGW